MKLTRMVAALILGLALCSSAIARPLAESGPSKWFHHDKKNPNRKKVAHHPKPTHRVTKQKTRKHS